MKWFDAALVAAAVGLSACTAVLCSGAEQRDPRLSAGLPLIILHEKVDGLVCRAAQSPEPSKKGDLHITLDHPDRRTLVVTLAHLCRQKRVDPERIVTHRDMEASCSCGAGLCPNDLVGDIRREMMR